MPYMTQFPMNHPPMPPEFREAIETLDDPGQFFDAIGNGMEAFGNAMQGGGDLAAAGDAFMDTMHQAIEGGDIPGMTVDAFDGMADAFANVAGPAMMGMPGDAGPADMADCMGDAFEHMMPEGMDMPAEMGPMFETMGNAIADGGFGPHDMGNEFGPPMPDGFEPGDPTSFPEGDFGPMAGGEMTGPQDFEGTPDPACFGDMTGVTGDITGCVGDMTDVTGDVTAMTGDFSGCEGDVTGCTGDMTGCAGDMGPMMGDMGPVYGDMTGCEGDVSGCMGNMGPVTGDMGPVYGDMGSA